MSNQLGTRPEVNGHAHVKVTSIAPSPVPRTPRTPSSVAVQMGDSPSQKPYRMDDEDDGTLREEWSRPAGWGVFFGLLILNIIFFGMFAVVFSAMGEGETVYHRLRADSTMQLGHVVIGISLAAFVVLYLLDWTYWKGFMRKARWLPLCLAGAGVYTAGFLLTRYFTTAPVVLWLFLNPLIVASLRWTIPPFKTATAYGFYRSLTASLLWTAFLLFLSWILWIFGAVTDTTNPWNADTRARIAIKSQFAYASWIRYGSCEPRLNNEKIGLPLNVTACWLNTDAEYYPCESGNEVNADTENPPQDMASVFTTAYEGSRAHIVECEQAGTALADCTAAEYDWLLPPSEWDAQVWNFTSGNNTNATGGSVSTYAGLNTPVILDVENKWQGARCADESLTVWLLYAVPFVGVGYCLAQAAVTWMFSKFMKGSKSNLKMVIKMSVILVSALAMGVWIAASIAGAGMQLSNVVSAFVGAGFIALVFVISQVVGLGRIKETARHMPMLKKIVAASESDFARGFFIFVMGIPLVLYYTMSCVNQLLRRCCCLVQTNTDSDPFTLAGGYKMTDKAYAQYQSMKHWHWVTVLRKANLLALLIWVFFIGAGKIVILFLAWLREVLSGAGLGYWTIVIIFVVIGLIMFLLPPVPGVPVYLTGGILLGSEDIFKSQWGEGNYGVAIFVACLICFGIKLMAISMQQKLIGGLLSKNTTVLRLVGVNKVSIKAIEKILKQPGLKIDKVAILIGGPDWPTSVLTGILRLSLIQMLIGSLPVFFLVVPCVCAGAFMGIKDPIMGPITAVTLTVAVLAQGASLVLSGVYIQRTAGEHFEELNTPRPEHAELDEMDRRDAEQEVLVKKATQWKLVPGIWKFVLVFGAVISLTSSYLAQLYGGGCFEKFDLSMSLSQLPSKSGASSGTAIDFLKPLGWVDLGLFILGIIFYKVFGCYLKKQGVGGSSTNKVLSADPEDPVSHEMAPTGA